MENSVKIMTHIIAFYPDRERSLTVAEALIAGRAAYLEIQFPYSDPSADGPVIQHACSKALEAGFTKEQGFAFVKKITGRFDIPVFIMSYGGLVFSDGVENFTLRAKEAGAAGLIIPDLTPGHDEGLYASGRKYGLAVVPVVAPSITEERILRTAEEGPEYVYAALRTGVTGKRTDIGTQEQRFLERLGLINGKIIAGFGIRSRNQIEELNPFVHALVIGSMIVGLVDENTGCNDTVLYDRIKRRIHHLVTGCGEEKEADRQ